MILKSLSQDPSTCRWYLFQDKYERLLISKGIIEGRRLEVDQPVPEMSSEVAGFEGAVDSRDNAVPLLGQIGGLDAKLKKLVILGQIGVVCTLIIAVFVVVGVILLLLNRE